MWWYFKWAFLFFVIALALIGLGYYMIEKYRQDCIHDKFASQDEDPPVPIEAVMAPPSHVSSRASGPPDPSDPADPNPFGDVDTDDLQVASSDDDDGDDYESDDPDTDTESDQDP